MESKIPTLWERRAITQDIKALHGYCKRRWNGKTETWEHDPKFICCASSEVNLVNGKAPRKKKQET